MIVVLSTSSPVASVALFTSQFEFLESERKEAPMAASGACLEILGKLFDRANKSIGDVDLFVADAGPGSFTGVKVAVTLVKTLAFAQGKQVASVSSFDLIAADRTVVFPSRKGEWFVRRTGQEVERVATLPAGDFVGYGPDLSEQVYPDAARASALLAGLTRLDPERLLPNYIAEPSISSPKKPYATPGAAPA